MALTNAAARGLACHDCRAWVLRSFITSIGSHAPSKPSLQRRTFSRPSRSFNKASDRIQKDSRALDNTDEVVHNGQVSVRETLSEQESVVVGSPPGPEPIAGTGQTDSGETLQSTDVTHVPWYLQQQPTVQTEESPLAARQRIPDIPQYAPEILQPLLEHVSIELGMDSLTLLDLRQLDPPPALGANLLMIIGTARSEKHLHVSADRLCRWLRTEYKMRPFADGLLGRNELKIKMRRKAKRARLMSAVGARSTGEGEMDDGIRTGWVCVNLGMVPGGELPEDSEKLQRAEGIVGFGAHSTGSNIVVQMMTEEKRGEIDLEKLWTGILNRARREKDKNKELDSSSTEVFESTNEASGVSQGVSTEKTQTYRPQRSSSGPGHQIRAFHTYTSRMEAVNPDQQTAEYPTAPLHTGIRKQSEVPSDSSAKRLNDILEDLLTKSNHSIREALKPLKIHVTENDAERTPFLTSFYQAMPAFPGPEHWHVHISLLCIGRRFGIEGIDPGTLVAQLHNLRISGHVPENQTYELVIKSILRPSGHEDPYSAVANPIPRDQLDYALCLMEDMECHGYNAFSPPILAALHRAAIGPEEPTTLDRKFLISKFGAARLRRLVTEDDWPAFWKTWRSYPRRFLPRTAEMYSVLLESLAEGNIRDPHEARDVLREAWGSMQVEWPAVKLDAGLAQTLLRAVEAVEPEDHVERGRISEWADVKKSCLEAMEME